MRTILAADAEFASAEDALRSDYPARMHQAVVSGAGVSPACSNG